MNTVKMAAAGMSAALILALAVTAQAQGLREPPGRISQIGPENLPARRASLFDLGIYGGGAYTTDWFQTGDPASRDDLFPDDLAAGPLQGGADPTQAFANSLGRGAWSTDSTWPVLFGGVKEAEIPVPGVGTVIRGGREIHILPPIVEEVTGAGGGVGIGVPASRLRIFENISPVPASRVIFSYNYFQADDSRTAQIDPNTDNVAFTLDRIFVFPNDNTTTGLFGGPRGMDVRQSFDIEQHRVESGLAVPIPAGPGTFIFTPGSVTQFSSQDYQSSLNLITLPDIQMTERREVEETLWGPALGGAFQLPVPLSRDPADPFPTLFLTAGGRAAALFGDTEFTSTQLLHCPICGPDFPVRQVTTGEVDNSVADFQVYFRAALAVGPRANLFVEIGRDRTERGAFRTPANPNEQPIRFAQEDVTDTWFRFGGSIGFGGGPVPPPPPPP